MWRTMHGDPRVLPQWYRMLGSQIMEPSSKSEVALATCGLIILPSWFAPCQAPWA